MSLRLHPNLVPTVLGVADGPAVLLSLPSLLSQAWLMALLSLPTVQHTLCVRLRVSAGSGV